jgi:hypothetical protein
MILSSLISSATLLGVSWADFEKEPVAPIAAKAPLEPGSPNRTIAGFEIERPVVEWTAYVEPRDAEPFPARGQKIRAKFATSIASAELKPPSPWAAESEDGASKVSPPAKATPPLPAKSSPRPVYASPQSAPVAQQPMGYPPQAVAYSPQTVAYAQPAYYAAPVASYAVASYPVGYQATTTIGGRRGPLRGIGRALFGSRAVAVGSYGASYGDASCVSGACGTTGYGYAAQPYGTNYAPTYAYAAQPVGASYGRMMTCGPNGCY